MTRRKDIEHHFPPNTGRTVGYIGLALAAGVIVVSIYYLPFRSWLTLALGCLAGGIAVWITLLRPRARATADDLVLLNMVSDTWIPLVSIERVQAKHALIVWANGKKYLCVGIAKPRRILSGRARSRSVSAGGGIQERAGWLTPQGARPTDGLYEDLVVARIGHLVDNARERGQQPGPVRRTPALLEIVLLVVSTAGFALALFL